MMSLLLVVVSLLEGLDKRVSEAVASSLSSSSFTSSQSMMLSLSSSSSPFSSCHGVVIGIVDFFSLFLFPFFEVEEYQPN